MKAKMKSVLLNIYIESTIHPVVCYFLENEELVQEDVVIISDDKHHDAAEVKQFEKVAIICKILNFQVYKPDKNLLAVYATLCKFIITSGNCPKIKTMKY